MGSLRRELGTLPPWKRTLATWGMVILLVQVGSWIFPLELSEAYGVVGIGGVFCLVCGFRFPTPYPKTFPFLIALLMQSWSIFTAIYASRYLGREMSINRANTYILWAVVPGFVAYSTCMLAPFLRQRIIQMIVVLFAASAAVAWLQFVRFPPAMALSRIYTYKAIDNWDGHPGIRAVGLSGQPNHLGFEAVLALALVCASVIKQPLTRRQWALAILFAGAVLFSQSRAAFIPLLLECIVILGLMARFNRAFVTKVVLGLICAGIVLSPLAAKRFQYMLMATSGNDKSFESRESLAWAQLDPILPRVPLTGIGPSSGLLEGGGPEDKWVPVGRPVESGYLLFQAMYGIPGMAIMIVGLLGSALLACRGIFVTQDSEQKQILAVGVVCSVALAVNATSFNTFDSYIHLPLAMIIAGLAAASPRASSYPALRRCSSRGLHPTANKVPKSQPNT